MVPILGNGPDAMGLWHGWWNVPISPHTLRIPIVEQYEERIIEACICFCREYDAEHAAHIPTNMTLIIQEGFVVLDMLWWVIALLSLVATAAAMWHTSSNSIIGADNGSIPLTVSSGESLFQEHSTLLNSTSFRGSGSKYIHNKVGGNDLSGVTTFSRGVLHDTEFNISPANVFPNSDSSSTPAGSMPDYPLYITNEDDVFEEAVNRTTSVNGHATTKRDISSMLNSSTDITASSKEVVYHSDKNKIFQSMEPEPVVPKKVDSEVLSHNFSADSSYADAIYTKSIYSAFDLNSAAIGSPYSHDNLVKRKKFSSEASEDYDNVATVTNIGQINSNETYESLSILSEIYNHSEFSDDRHLHSVSDVTDYREKLPQDSDTHPKAHSNTEYRTSGSVAEEVQKDTLGIQILPSNSPDVDDSTSAELDNNQGHLQNTFLRKYVPNNIGIQSSKSSISDINIDNFSLKVLNTLVALLSGRHQISDNDSNQDSSDSHEVQLKMTRFTENKTSQAAEVNSGKQTHSIFIPDYADSNSASESESTESQSIETPSSGGKTGQKIDNSASNSESKTSQSIGASFYDHETEQLIDCNSGLQSESISSQLIGPSSPDHETGQNIYNSIDSYSETTTSQSMGTLSFCYETDKQIDSNIASHSESAESQSLAISYSHETSPQIDSICESYPETAASQLLGASSSSQYVDSSSVSLSENTESQSMGRSSSGHETGQQIESNAASNSESVALQSTETSSYGQDIIQKTDRISTSHSESMESQSMGKSHSGHENGQQIFSNSALHSGSTESQSMKSFSSGHEIGRQTYSTSASNSESMASQPMEKFSSGQKTGQLTIGSFDDLDKTAWTRSRYDKTSYSDGLKSGLSKAQTLYSGSPNQDYLAGFIDSYIPLHFATQDSGYSETPFPNKLSRRFRSSNDGSTGGQEFGLPDLPGYMTGSSSGQSYSRNYSTVESLLNQGSDTYVQEEHQFSGRSSPVSGLPSDSLSSELLDSSHSLGKKLKMSLEAQNPLNFAGNEEFRKSDRFGLARFKALKEYLSFSSRVPGHVFGTTSDFRPSQLYHPDFDLTSYLNEPHYTSSPLVHRTAPSTRRKTSGTPGDFEHIEYGVSGTHSRVSTLSSGKSFPRIPGSYTNLDTGVYRAYDPQFKAKSYTSYLPSFDILLPSAGREIKTTYPRVVTSPEIIQKQAGGARQHSYSTKTTRANREEDVEYEH
ncbi:hypothetical protein PR048_024556 [Dryococelus australis]|uniref:Uncharacterized protein n=1 Tax=Dryococelus australis TaxID=614101 RepID=A0ABQ9GNV8_9NEOP|nr:hypothetical protein PR048_024556 [Dryococelus australis]